MVRPPAGIEPLSQETELLLHLNMAGDYWRADRLELAFAAMVRALNLGIAPSSIYDLQRTIEAELEARRDAVIVRADEHLLIEIPAGIRSCSPMVRAAALEAMRQVATILRCSWGRPILVTVFRSWTSVEFMHARFGYFVSRNESLKVCLPPGVATHPVLLNRALLHEIGHAAVSTVARDRAPRWLTEGIAVWLEGPTPQSSDVVAEVPGQTPLSMSQVSAQLGSFLIPLDGPDAARAYSSAGRFISWLTEHDAGTGLGRVLRALGESGSIEGAFRRHLGSALAKLERAWRASLR